MNWDALGAVGEIVGAAAVLATLIYLARQVTHSVNLARAQQNKGLMDSYHGWNELIANNPAMAEVLAEATKPRSELSPGQLVQLRHLAYRAIDVYMGAQLSYTNNQLSKPEFEFYKHDIKVICGFYPRLLEAFHEIFSLYPNAENYEIFEGVKQRLKSSSTDEAP